MPGNRLTTREFLLVVLKAISSGSLFASQRVLDAIAQCEESPISITVKKARRVIDAHAIVRANAVMHEDALAQAATVAAGFDPNELVPSSNGLPGPRWRQFRAEATVLRAERAVAEQAANVEMHAKMDDLLQFMSKHFDPKTTSAAEVRLLLNDRQQLGIQGDLLTEVELSRLTNGLVPVAVVREFLSFWMVRFDPKKVVLDDWARFIQDYRDVIIAA